MYPDQAMYDPSYVIPKDEYNNKSNQVVVHNTNKEDVYKRQVLSCTISSFAQSHSDRLSLGVGALYERGLDEDVYKRQ